jgi:tetratricopeptide (TPR) repeat protein
MLTTTHLANNTPLAWLSYGLDYAVWGLDPVGYHLTNILLHALNAALLFRISSLLLGRVFPDEPPSRIGSGAAAAALAFALHPLRVESVAWASERRDVLAGLFYLSTVLYYVKSALAGGTRERSRWYAVSLFFFACAALSKSTVVPLPLALLALDFYPLKRLGSGEPLRARLVEKLPYLALSALSAAMAVRAQVASGNLVSVSDHGLTSRLAQALYGAGFYVRRTVFPADLHALYPLGSPDIASLPSLLSAATIVLAALAGHAARVPRRAQAALWGYYLILLLPVLGLVQNGRQLVADRYSYLSCLGWAVLAGAATVSAVRLRKSHPVRGAVMLGTLGVWLASNAWAVQRRIAVWHDDRALWEDVLARYPLSIDANVNFADALLQEKDLPAAESRARLALTLEPANASANLTLAKTLLAEDRPAESRAAVERGLKYIPVWGDGDALLGVLLNAEGRDEEAQAHLLRAAALLPASAEAQANAGGFLALHGRFAEALPYFEKAARLDPAYAGRLEHVKADLGRSPSR